MLSTIINQKDTLWNGNWVNEVSIFALSFIENLNKVAVTKQFKEITKKLCDLADEFDSIGRNSPLNVKKGRKITWEMSWKLDRLVELNRDESIDNSKTRGHASFKKQNHDEAKCRIQFHHEIKEEANEAEDDLINLNLWPLDEQNSSKRYSGNYDFDISSGESSKDSRSSENKDTFKNWEKKRKRRKYRKNCQKIRLI